MTTYQVQLRDFRSKRITRIICEGAGHTESTRAGQGALSPHLQAGDRYHYSLPFNRQIEIHRSDGLHRDEYIRLVPEPPPSCDRCGCQMGENEGWMNEVDECVCEICARPYADRCWDHLDEPPEDEI